MPTTRAILSAQSADELRAGADLYELEVDDRRVKADLADALAKSRKTRIETILEPLSRNRLKALCRALNLDDSGRRKSDIITRFTAASRPSKGSEAPKATRKDKRRGNTAEGDDWHGERRPTDTGHTHRRAAQESRMVGGRHATGHQPDVVDGGNEPLEAVAQSQ